VVVIKAIVLLPAYRNAVFDNLISPMCRQVAELVDLKGIIRIFCPVKNVSVAFRNFYSRKSIPANRVTRVNGAVALFSHRRGHAAGREVEIVFNSKSGNKVLTENPNAIYFRVRPLKEPFNLSFSPNLCSGQSNNADARKC
jgi:hypothetical protein